MITSDQFTSETMALSPVLFRLSMSILRQEADCQDAVQQALLNTWAARERIDPDRLRPYLTRVVINECRNIQRQRMRVVPMAELPDSEAAPPRQEGALKEAVSRLPETLRTPLLLHYMEAFSIRETAMALGLSQTAVKSKLFRARKALKKWLTQEEAAI